MPAGTWGIVRIGLYGIAKKFFSLKSFYIINSYKIHIVNECKRNV